MEKMVKVTVRGVALTHKEKAIYDLVVAKGSVVANDLLGEVKDLSIHSIRATLSRLEKQHNLLKGSKVLRNDKPLMSYKVAE